VTLHNIETLTKQLRETRDYSRTAETVYLMKELILEQTTEQLQPKDENSNHTTHQTR
jgi:hypothetical protein